MARTSGGSTQDRPTPWQSSYDDLVEQWLGRPHVTLGRALRTEGLMVRGKLFAFLRGDRLVVKLPRDRARQEVAAGGDFLGYGGRVMKEWVELPLDAARWRALAEESHDYVAVLAERPR